MVNCACGKTIESVPDWLADVKVQFVCNNCPNRELQGITQVDLTGGKAEEAAPMRAEPKADGADDAEEEEEEED